MMDGTKLVKELHSLLPDWVFRLVNTKGLLGRIITSWKASYWSLNNSWDMDSVLSMKLVSLITWKVYLLVNVYGPYANWVSFWDGLLSKKLLEHNSLILGGDLNFSLDHAEVWGLGALLILLQASFYIF